MLPVLEDNNLYRKFWVNKRGIAYPEGYHLGKDFGLDIGKNVYSVWNGIIIEAGLHEGYGSLNPSTKGGCIWIKYQKDDKIFYANYGHINIDKNIIIGKEIKEGEILGIIAHFTNHGVYLSHLHFGIWDSKEKYPSNHWGYQKENDKKHWVDPIPFLKQYKII